MTSVNQNQPAGTSPDLKEASLPESNEEKRYQYPPWIQAFADHINGDWKRRRMFDAAWSIAISTDNKNPHIDPKKLPVQDGHFAQVIDEGIMEKCSDGFYYPTEEAKTLRREELHLWVIEERARRAETMRLLGRDPATGRPR